MKEKGGKTKDTEETEVKSVKEMQKGEKIMSKRLSGIHFWRIVGGGG